MRITQILYVLAILAILTVNGFKNESHISRNSGPELDTLSGFFLYESNVPFMCYTNRDQLEQEHCLIYYSDSLVNKNIAELYRKGMFFDGPISPIVSEALKKGISIKPNMDNIWRFRRLTAPYLYGNNNNYSGAIYDSSKNLTYIKIRAKMIVRKIGKMKWLIPKTAEYKYCYSNTKEEIETYLIEDFIDFKVY